MNLYTRILICCFLVITTSCAIKPPIVHQYTLNSFSSVSVQKKTTPRHTILVTKPEALAGYQTDQMLYMKKPHERLPFAESAWASPPAGQLLPLIIQSLAQTHRFKAIVSSSTPETADYQLDTELIDLYQNFLKRPSEMILTVKVTLSRPSTNRIIASHITHIRQRCLSDTPYGGVVAANAAVRQLTRETTQFVMQKIE